MRKTGVSIGNVLAAFLVSLVATAAPASTSWNWTYTEAEITASGTFTTADLPDPTGGYLITGITGTRNGRAIVGLQPTGTAIPGNEPFDVDNLVFLQQGQQLTKAGFGFATADGNFANPFFADFLPTPSYLEFFSTPPFNDGGQGTGDSELPIQFSASPVPEPSFSAAIACALALGFFGSQFRKVTQRRELVSPPGE
jgi:hypothetical protein